MNGFEKDLKNNILKFIPQALIISTTGSINPKWTPISTVSKLKRVSHVSSLTTNSILIQSADNIAIGIMLGINPNEADPLYSYLIKTKEKKLKARRYNAIIGQQLANILKVHTGDKI